MSGNQFVAGSEDAASDAIAGILKAIFTVLLVLVALPLVVPVLAGRIAGDGIATRTRFWLVWRWHWLANTIGITLVTALVGTEIVLATVWVQSGQAHAYFAGADWRTDLAPTLVPWMLLNLFAGVLLLPVAWSIRRRRIADRVRSRRILDVVRQEKIETARKRAADSNVARSIGVLLDRNTGRITGTTRNAVTVPLYLDAGRSAFGVTSRVTVRTLADRFYDARRVRDWVDPTGTYLVLPGTSSALRALIIAESGSGKSVLITGLVLCALEYGWPVFVIDAKGDPADAADLVAVAESYGRTAVAGGTWDFFNGTAEQVTAKLMRLMPAPDGANQHYLDEIRGVLQAVQDYAPIRSVIDLRERLTDPGPHARDQYDLSMVNKVIDRDGTTAGERALQSLLVALRPLERWIGPDGWSYDAHAPTSPSFRCLRSTTRRHAWATCSCWTCGTSWPPASNDAIKARWW
ncbi:MULTISPECIES: hypothetical protein [unclassified Cryobacterium]|uniref:hypothetical protein n=1 Tax=unclassified Cryobacterium TaxID=2649013 RepID=UPI002AB4FFE6|nr:MULTISPECIES: hypothetical protein [unclassified Cryobacterium]MDY7543033.1 hypothetical protein [Cryobacterium sp. 5B3]MEB0000362.1 hypothetical protein [Cryobacterium sp. RTS3]MEB0266076.1 hypothetical protein [Cryobacterium sp. 10I5]MEB0274024.1 hypothetical protein [Cryobacterium sp. 5B3]